MSLLKWLRSREAATASGSTASPRTRSLAMGGGAPSRPAITPPPVGLPLKTVPPPTEQIPVDARALVAGWRPGDHRIVVRTATPLGRGTRVALRLQGEVGVNAPVTGTVTGTRTLQAGGPGGRPIYSADVIVDADRRGMLRRVQEYFDGRASLPREREPRYRMSLPAVVSAGPAALYMKTFSLSRGGCGLSWAGERPPAGAYLNVRLGGGPTAPSFRARVCWVRGEPQGTKVGLRFLAGGDPQALLRLLGEVSERDLEAVS
ncbi:MAG: PilZ domain-containing protein [Anaeromyxobacteraceae bacterium]